MRSSSLRRQSLHLARAALQRVASRVEADARDLERENPTRWQRLSLDMHHWALRVTWELGTFLERYDRGGP